MTAVAVLLSTGTGTGLGDFLREFLGGLLLALLIVIVLGVPFLYLLRAWMKHEFHEEE